MKSTSSTILGWHQDSSLPGHCPTSTLLRAFGPLSPLGWFAVRGAGLTAARTFHFQQTTATPTSLRLDSYFAKPGHHTCTTCSRALRKLSPCLSNTVHRTWLHDTCSFLCQW